MRLPHLTIVGSGILGLSVAWHFACRASLFENITLIDDSSPYAGSAAAAALLATHGQQFPRHAHFVLKLRGKEKYPAWLEELSGQSLAEISAHFAIGWGVDCFTTSELCQKHEVRVRETENNVPHMAALERTFDPESIIRSSPTTIQYKNEAWVDAPWLLNLLKQRLAEKGVVMRQEKVDRNFFEKHLNDAEFFNDVGEFPTSGAESPPQNVIVLCTGAWTKSLLQELNLNLPATLQQRKERLSLATTHFGATSPWGGLVSFLGSQVPGITGDSTPIFEKWYNENKTSLTWSPVAKTLSGVSHTAESFEELLKVAGEMSLGERQKSDLNSEVESHQKLGLRVGYGRPELCVEEVHDPRLKNRVVVCAGAHRSGFLLAPLVGEMVENVLGD